MRSWEESPHCSTHGQGPASVRATARGSSAKRHCFHFAQLPNKQTMDWFCFQPLKWMIGCWVSCLTTMRHPRRKQIARVHSQQMHSRCIRKNWATTVTAELRAHSVPGTVLGARKTMLMTRLGFQWLTSGEEQNETTRSARPFWRMDAYTKTSGVSRQVKSRSHGTGHWDCSNSTATLHAHQSFQPSVQTCGVPKHSTPIVFTAQ